MEKVKVAVVGVGHMGKEHARVYSKLEMAELVGVYDIDRDVGVKVAQHHHVKCFQTIEELAEVADAVSVATPTLSHFEIGEQLLRAGKHTLLEKPITSSTNEATDLIQLAKENGAVLQVGHVERFNPVLEALEERLTQPRFIEAHRLSPYPGRSTDIGVVMDLMIHDLEIILHLVRSPVESVDAVGVAVLSKGEDIANARIRFQNGCIANITTSRISPEKMRKIRVFQDDAYLSLDYQNQKGEMYRKEAGQIKRETIPIRKEEPLLRQLESFLQCVSQRQEPVVSADHATRALHAAADIVEQIWSQEKVMV